jgi:alpha-ribazole phosphatase
MQLYLIRHPQPRDARGRCYGREDLSVGADALRDAAASIRAQIPRHVLEGAEFFTSPLSRCSSLARELAAPRAPTIAEDLLEMDFGTWEGKPWESVPRDQLDAWASDLWGYRPGGGESATMVADRWRRWASQIRGSGVAAAIAVTHAGFIRVALACAGRLSADEFVADCIAFGSVHRIDPEECRTPACAAP